MYKYTTAKQPASKLYLLPYIARKYVCTTRVIAYIYGVVICNKNAVWSNAQ